MSELRPRMGLGGRSRARALRIAILAVSVVTFTACTGTAPAGAHEDPADPYARGSFLGYEPVLEGYEAIEIVKKPGDWRAANDLAEQLDGPRGQMLQPGAMPPKKKKPKAIDDASDDGQAEASEPATAGQAATP